MRQSFTVQKPTRGRNGYLYSFKPWFFKLLLESKPRAINWYLYGIKKIYESRNAKVYFNHAQTLLLEQVMDKSNLASKTFQELMLNEITVKGLTEIIHHGISRYRPGEYSEELLKVLNILAEAVDRAIEQDTPRFVDDTGENVD